MLDPHTVPFARRGVRPRRSRPVSGLAAHRPEDLAAGRECEGCGTVEGTATVLRSDGGFDGVRWLGPIGEGRLPKLQERSRSRPNGFPGVFAPGA